MHALAENFILSFGLVGDGVDFTAGAGDHYGQDAEPDRRAEKPYGSVGECEIRHPDEGCRTGGRIRWSC